MRIIKNVFGQLDNGRPVYRYSLSNRRGLQADVINYGAALVRLLVPDRKGNLADVVTGYDHLPAYVGKHPYFGVTVGPNANRIGNAAFTLEGITYHLEPNNGPNNLHSHSQLGYQKRVWDEQINDDSVTFLLADADGGMGFPGNKQISVTYSLTEDNALRIEYDAQSDKNTIINLTNHTYFNLGGHQCATVNDHILTLRAAHYTPVRSGAIPTGEIVPVAGTPMDFTGPKRIGDEIDADFEQLKLVGGYDHNWVIDGANGSLREFARLIDPESGRCMTAATDLPGVQFYTGNSINEHSGKAGVIYKKRCALCLETQYFPDSANQPAFPPAIFGPDRVYHSTTVYRFE